MNSDLAHQLTENIINFIRFSLLLDKSTYPRHCHQSDGSVWVWHMLRERLLPECIVPVVKFSGGEFMVWELLPCLEKAADSQKGERMFVSRAAAISITSKFASLTNMTDDQDWLNSIPYRVSKTALNMSMRILSVIVKDAGILVVCIHPGWVKTEMGKEEAPEETADAIAGLFERLSQLNETHHGTFMEKNGTPIPL
ncbi:uncharacterized protein TNCV_173881 [Trichonephila clavipes]|nr:uncharacterized protein TNCV_173881 [Trichonephila clavipes]